MRSKRTCFSRGYPPFSDQPHQLTFLSATGTASYSPTSFQIEAIYTLLRTQTPQGAALREAWNNAEWEFSNPCDVIAFADSIAEFELPSPARVRLHMKWPMRSPEVGAWIALLAPEKLDGECWLHTSFPNMSQLIIEYHLPQEQQIISADGEAAQLRSFDPILVLAKAQKIKRFAVVGIQSRTLRRWLREHMRSSRVHSIQAEQRGKHGPFGNDTSASAIGGDGKTVQTRETYFLDHDDDIISDLQLRSIRVSRHLQAVITAHRFSGEYRVAGFIKPHLLKRIYIDFVLEESEGGCECGAFLAENKRSRTTSIARQGSENGEIWTASMAADARGSQPGRLAERSSNPVRAGGNETGRARPDDTRATRAPVPRWYLSPRSRMACETKWDSGRLGAHKKLTVRDMVQLR